MKLIMESWRKNQLNEDIGLIKSISSIWGKVTDPTGAKKAQKETEEIAKAFSNKINTIGDLINLIKVFKKNEKTISGLKKIDSVLTNKAIDLMVGPGVDIAKSLLQWFGDTYIFKKQLSPQDTLKYFRIDPELAAVVDNDIEEAFVSDFIQRGIDDPKFASQKIDGFNMNTELKDFIAKRFKSRTVSGPSNLFK